MAVGDGTEYGGDPGLIQPPPHMMTSAERRMQILRAGSVLWDAPDDGGLSMHGLVPLKEGDLGG